MHDLVEQFITIWVVIDPIGTIPVFVAVTATVEQSERKKIALSAVFFALAVLLFFLVAGQFLIGALGISLPAFQIAGGIILFLFALSMIFGDSKPQTELKDIDRGEERASPAVFPLAVPSLAGPGAMLAIVLLTDNNRFSFAEQAVTAGLLVMVLGCCLILMLLANPILKVIGMSGSAIISRVMGMILAAVAVDNVIAATLEVVKLNTT